MKEKCRGIKSSIIIIILSLFLSAIFQFCHMPLLDSKIQDYIVMLFGGAAASALVTLIIYSSEYQSTKNTALADYWEAQFSLLQKIGGIEYYYFNMPIELLQEYFIEQSHNQLVKSHIAQLPTGAKILDDDFFRLKHEALNKWCNIITDNYTELKDTMSLEQYQQMLINSVEDSASEQLASLKKIISEYCLLSQLSYKESEKNIGNIEFFTGRKKWKKIYTEIHQPMRTLLSDITQSSRYFKRYLNNEANSIPISFFYIEKLQKTIFSTENQTNELRNKVSVYNEFYDKMGKLLEDFRANIYKSAPEYQEKRCVFVTTHFYKTAQSEETTTTSK